MFYQAVQLTHVLYGQLKEVAEDAEREKALKDVAEASAIKKTKAAVTTEKKAAVTEKARMSTKKKSSEIKTKLGENRVEIGKGCKSEQSAGKGVS